MEFDCETIRSRLRELAFLNSAATIQYRAAKGDVAAAEWTEYHFAGGLKEFVTWTNRDREAMHKPIYITKEVRECPCQGCASDPPPSPPPTHPFLRLFRRPETGKI